MCVREREPPARHQGESARETGERASEKERELGTTTTSTPRPPTEVWLSVTDTDQSLIRVSLIRVSLIRVSLIRVSLIRVFLIRCH